MKVNQLNIALIGMLGVMFFTPGILFARNPVDSVLINRVFDYRRNYAHDIKGHQQNAYLKYSFISDRRNFTLFVIPHMYSIAQDEKAYFGESYCRMTYKNAEDIVMRRQVSVGNISHYGKALPTATELMTPNLYNVCLFKRHILSPFNRSNERFYHYRVTIIGNGMAVIAFKPKNYNTQLVSGQAYVRYETGRITTVEIEGEYDMLDFKLFIEQSDTEPHTILPKHCQLDARFDFMGNHIRAKFEALYDLPTRLPDSLNSVRDMSLMDSIRPLPLEEEEKAIYAEYCPPPSTLPSDTLLTPPSSITPSPSTHKFNFWTDFMWDVIGDHVFNGIGMRSQTASFKLSPLLNPQYFSYSKRHGLSYKMKIGAQYNFSEHRYLTLNPKLGYNFKYRQFYFTAPLRMTYNPKRNGYAEVEIGNGNRITNSSVLETIIDERGDTTGLNDQGLDLFTDNYITVKNNVEAFDWLEIMTSFSYHHRKAINPEYMIAMKRPTHFRSFAPVLTLKITPWHDGPTFTFDYERGIENFFKSNIGYERWEMDGVWKIPMRSLSLLNVRIGAGFYTAKKSSYFVDYANFRDNNVPGGWEDDWTGQFQLLNSSWYNASDYYVRTNLSYDTPLFLSTWLPLVGRYIENERIYFSALLLDHTRPYYEVGYGLTNRYFSAGVFASFLNSKFQECGTKISFELFRKW